MYFQSAVFPVFLYITLCGHGEAYPNGAPATACVTMTPIHVASSPQTTLPPFEINLLGTTQYSPNQNITVILSPPCSLSKISGFILEVRRVDAGQNRDEPLGTFTSSSNNKYVASCGNGRQALTHIDPTPKSLITAVWTAPPQGVGHIAFVATFAEEKSVYWVKVFSSVIREESNNVNPDLGGITYPTPSTCSEVPTQPPPPQLRPDPNCSTTKSCISDCQGDSCGYIVSWLNSTTNARATMFELAAIVGKDSNQWMAIGFSTDDQMGEDKVVECIAYNNQINVYPSYNTITPRLDNERNAEPKPSDGILPVNGSIADGIFRCSFLVVTEEFSYINLTSPWYLLFASGKTASFRDTKLQHPIVQGSFPFVSPNKITFQGQVYTGSKNESLVPNVAALDLADPILYLVALWTGVSVLLAL